MESTQQFVTRFSFTWKKNWCSVNPVKKKGGKNVEQLWQLNLL